MDFSIFDPLVDGVCVVDPQGNVIYANQGLATSCGLSLKRFKQKKHFSNYFCIQDPSWLDTYTQIKDVTPYQEVGFESSVGTIGKFQIAIRPVFLESHLNTARENSLWIIYLRDVTLENTLMNKFTTEKDKKKDALEKARIDSLTGILNKGAFIEEIGRLFQLSQERQFSFSVIFFDLDNFKKFNDTYGHLAGDLALHTVAAKIKESVLRTGDIFARYGGEEFVILLRRSSMETARRVAERARQAVQEVSIIYEDQVLMTTVSVGVSCVRTSDSSWEEVIKRADGATYESKKNGKNTVTLAA